MRMPTDRPDGCVDDDAPRSRALSKEQGGWAAQATAPQGRGAQGGEADGERERGDRGQGDGEREENDTGERDGGRLPVA